MKIRRLYLGDFGILRNQTLDDIGQGLIVIGGPNRAGKTSFMQVLRYLGYGFPRGGNLPSATHEYHVEATISLESDIWDLRLRGYGNPQVSGVGGRTTDASTLFGGLDMFTYHQLFTISLDELRLLPEGVEKGEGGALQSVLLGAGLADVARIPGIVKELDKEADRIGASRGRPHVREFKPYHEIIRENAKERDGALERLDEYQTHMQELADIKNRIDEVQEQLLGYRHQRTRLETLLHNHDDYHRWVELDEILSSPEILALVNGYPGDLLGKAEVLQERYIIARAEYEEKSLDLEGAMGSLDLEGVTLQEWQERLLANSTKIDLAVRNLSGLEARISAMERGALEQQAEHRQIQDAMDDVNPAWYGDFDVIQDITSHVDKDQLTKAVKDHGLLTEALNICRRMGQIEAPDISKHLRTYWLVATVTTILGVIVGFVQPLFGASIVVVGAIGFGIYLMYKGMSSRVSEPEWRDLCSQLIDIGSQLGLVIDGKDLGRDMETLEHNMDSVTKQLEIYRVLLGLGEAAEFSSYGERFAEVRRLKERIRRLEHAKGGLEDELHRLQSTLSKMHELVTELGHRLPAPQPTTTYFHQLSVLVEQTASNLKRAEAMDLAGRQLVNLEQQVRALAEDMYSSGQVALAGEDTLDPAQWLEDAIWAGRQYAEYKALAKERETLKQRMLHSLGRRETAALEALANEAAAAGEPWVDELTRSNDRVDLLALLYEGYGSKGDLEEALHSTGQMINELAQKSIELVAHRDDLSRKLADLDTDQTLLKAQRRIDEARRSLKPLALEYSVYRVAALMLETLRKEFIREVQDELLAKACWIFQEMTGGDYREIAPLAEITEAGFQVAKSDGDTMLPEALSRATTEQLFLAVRLGRIQEIAPPLPVILDDCLVNFDTRHAYQAIRIIAGLAERHQIFVLTCHPELVEMIHDVGRGDTDYWELDGGVFSRSDAEGLVKYLGRM